MPGSSLQIYLNGLRALCVAAMALVISAPALASTKAYRAAVDKQFAPWLAELKREALERGVASETFDAAFKGVRPDWKLPDLEPPELGPGKPARPKKETAGRQKQQAEFDRPGNYFPRRGLEYITTEGRKLKGKWKDTLKAIEEKFGVGGHIVLAIWGRETAFGRAKIPHYTIRALATQAYIGRRQDRFREELLLALKILQDGHVTRKRMRSSWAGAMGHTQFLPSDFHNYAVDFNNDGRRDIWGTIPDALASTANFLATKGWKTGKTWGYEVRLPKGFDCTLEGVKNARPVSEWAELGITRSFDRKFRDDRMGEKAHLMAPAGTFGPAFLVLENFEVFRAYNKADLYALYVGHVADRILFAGGFEGSWSKVPGFQRNEMRRLQTKLAAEGFDVGKIDGLMGSRTRAAVGAWQKRLGHTVTCYPPRSLLKLAPPLEN